MSSKVAVVTGSNKGIGLAVVKGLCQKYNGTTYLTSRNEDKGKDAIKKLNQINLYPEYHQLDITDEDSIKEFAKFIKEKHGGLDVLVNNAAIMYWHSEYPTYEEAKHTIETNYKSLLNIESYIIFPLLKSGARVVNVSSACGHLSNLRNLNWITKLKDKDLTIADLDSFVDAYLESVKNGTFDKNDFADGGRHADLRVAKIAVTALTFIQQRKYFKRNISINAIHPGHVKTDMSNGTGNLEPDDAAKGILYLVLEASENLKGVFMWHDRTLVDWLNHENEYYAKFCDK